MGVSHSRHPQHPFSLTRLLLSAPSTPHPIINPSLGKKKKRLKSQHEKRWPIYAKGIERRIVLPISIPLTFPPRFTFLTPPRKINPIDSIQFDSLNNFLFFFLPIHLPPNHETSLSASASPHPRLALPHTAFHVPSIRRVLCSVPLCLTYPCFVSLV